MKSKDMQKVVLSKYEKRDGATKILQDLNGTVSLFDDQTMVQWNPRNRLYQLIQTTWSSNNNSNQQSN